MGEMKCACDEWSSAVSSVGMETLFGRVAFNTGSQHTYQKTSSSTYSEFKTKTKTKTNEPEVGEVMEMEKNK